MLAHLIDAPMSARPASWQEQVRLGSREIEQNGPVVIAWLSVREPGGNNSLKQVRADCERRWYTKLSEVKLNARGHRQRTLRYYPEWHEISAGSVAELEWRFICTKVYRP